MSWLCIGLLLLIMTMSGRSVTASGTPEVPALRIVLVGDSTVASYSKPPADRPSLTGWGQVLQEFFNNQVVVLNQALSGAVPRVSLPRGTGNPRLHSNPITSSSNLDTMTSRARVIDRRTGNRLSGLLATVCAVCSRSGSGARAGDARGASYVSRGPDPDDVAALRRCDEEGGSRGGSSTCRSA